MTQGNRTNREGLQGRDGRANAGSLLPAAPLEASAQRPVHDPPRPLAPSTGVGAQYSISNAARTAEGHGVSRDATCTTCERRPIVVGIAVTFRGSFHHRVRCIRPFNVEQCAHCGVRAAVGAAALLVTLAAVARALLALQAAAAAAAGAARAPPPSPWVRRAPSFRSTAANSARAAAPRALSPLATPLVKWSRCARLRRAPARPPFFRCRLLPVQIFVS